MEKTRTIREDISMNYCDIKEVDIANGEGVRVSLFVSGCTFQCKGCFNKEAWDFNAGKKFTFAELEKLVEIMDRPYIKGISILGGEPLHEKNIADVLFILSVVKSAHPEKSIWLYTGYKYESVAEMPEYAEIVGLVDVIVDGQFEIDKKSPSLKFRGSTNQRIIDVKKTVAYNRIEEWQSEYDVPEKRKEYTFKYTC